MTVPTSSGARLFIGPANDSASVLGDYTALSWTLVGEVEDLGEFGDAWNSATFAALADSRVRKFKTTRNAGTMEMVLGFDASDSGQTALVAALDSKRDYAFKIDLDDEPVDSPANPTTWYFRAKVMSNRRRVGNSETGAVRRAVTLEINSAVIEVAAAEN